jgi:hypothetical protein
VNPAPVQASGGSATSISATVMPMVDYGIPAGCMRGLNHDAVANLSGR